MAGRIKIYENGAPLNSEDTPALIKEPDVVSAYDESCGTFGVGDYTRDSGKCPADAFICTEGDETPAQLLFGECMYALDCHMNYNMKSILANSDPRRRTPDEGKRDARTVAALSRDGPRTPGDCGSPIYRLQTRPSWQNPFLKK